jgi:DNA modification methylase
LEPTINLFRLNYSHILTFCKNDKLVPKNKLKEFRYDIFNLKHQSVDGFTHGFPEALIELLIHKYSNEGQVIYDPFMGSGTVPLKCIQTNRKYLGSEISEKTYTI